MFFGKIISYTFDMHIRLDILNPLNIIVLSSGLKHEFSAFKPFLSNFQNFDIFVWFDFSSSLSN
jgi:hypothetical protein